MNKPTAEEIVKKFESDLKEKLSKIWNDDLITKNNEAARREMTRILDKQLLNYVETIEIEVKLNERRK